MGGGDGLLEGGGDGEADTASDGGADSSLGGTSYSAMARFAAAIVPDGSLLRRPIRGRGAGVSSALADGGADPEGVIAEESPFDVLSLDHVRVGTSLAGADLSAAGGGVVDRWEGVDRRSIVERSMLVAVRERVWR